MGRLVGVMGWDRLKAGLWRVRRVPGAAHGRVWSRVGRIGTRAGAPLGA